MHSASQRRGLRHRYIHESELGQQCSCMTPLTEISKCSKFFKHTCTQYMIVCLRKNSFKLNMFLFQDSNFGPLFRAELGVLSIPNLFALNMAHGSTCSVKQETIFPEREVFSRVHVLGTKSRIQNFLKVKCWSDRQTFHYVMSYVFKHQTDKKIGAFGICCVCTLLPMVVSVILCTMFVNFPFG